MNLATPWTAVIAAALALPLLVLLYLLKLRRRTLRLPSTLLWRKAVLDLQVNAPFQRLRWSVLFALQLAALLALLLALAGPRTSSADASAHRVILLIDRSASMQARTSGVVGGEATRTRLDGAKAAAIEYGRRAIESDGAREVMVMAFGRRAGLVTTATSSVRSLTRAIEAIEGSNEPADLQAALDLAGQYAAARSEDDRAADIALFTDGGAMRPDGESGFVLRAGSLRLISIPPLMEGQASEIDNVGIVALGARRANDDPGRVSIHARLVNIGGAAVDVPVEFSVDGVAVDRRMVNVPPLADGRAGEAGAGSALALEGGGLVTVRIDRPDELAADNEASIVLPPPVAPRILVLHPPDGPDVYLRDLLRKARLGALNMQEVASDSDANVDADDLLAAAGEASIDLLVLDRVSLLAWPHVPTLTIGAIPQPLHAAGSREADGDAVDERARRVLSWDRQHPLLRHVALDDVVYAGLDQLNVPEEVESLVYGQDGPIVALARVHDLPHVVIGFSLENSNWPLDISFAVFMQNVFDQPAVSAAGEPVMAQTGAAMMVRALPGAGTVRLRGPLPSGSTVAEAPVDADAAGGAGRVDRTLDIGGDGQVIVPGCARVGLYAVEGSAIAGGLLPVNLLSDVESDLHPRASLDVNASDVRGVAAAQAAPVELWPWLALAFLVLIVLEWGVYLARSRGG